MQSKELLKGTLQTIILKLLSGNEKMYGYEITQRVKNLSDGKLILTEGALLRCAGHYNRLPGIVCPFRLYCWTADQRDRCQEGNRSLCEGCCIPVIKGFWHPGIYILHYRISDSMVWYIIMVKEFWIQSDARCVDLSGIRYYGPCYCMADYRVSGYKGSYH